MRSYGGFRRRSCNGSSLHAPHVRIQKNPMSHMCGYRISAYTLQINMTEGERLGWKV